MPTLIRRTFLVGVSGLLTWPLVKRIETHILQHGQPYLEDVQGATKTLFVYPDSDFQITLGSRDDLDDVPTWREYLIDNGILPRPPTKPRLSHFREALEHHGVSPRQLDETVDDEEWFESRPRTSTPNGAAYQLLSALDIGPELRDEGGHVGELRFIDGAGPGNDYLGVHCSNLLTVSLLQMRLRELGELVRVRIG